MMTNERAIELLKRISDSQFDGEYGEARREALSMAVRALKQNLVKESGGLVKDLVKDCISRKMAIDEVKRLHDVAWANWKETRISANTMIDALKDLPSAQPETHDKRTETHACDLINRQQAIDAVAKWVYDVFGIKESDGTATIFKRLRELSPAQPERKAGKWVELSHGILFHVYKCDQCGNTIDMNGVNAGRGDANFCPNCGADMRGESDETD